MSVLDTPRVYFRGQMTWDPIVTNNYVQLYDQATGKPVLGDATADEYRERARQAVTNGNWNPHGTHRSTLFETTVSGVDLGDGPAVDDALVGVPVSFTGMLVDLQPYGSTTSQLFFDQLSVGIEGGSQILAPCGGPMVARRINFTRNNTYRVIAGVASVVWQTSFPSDGGLLVHPRGSAVLEALREILAHEENVGLTVRMNAYRTVYYDTEQPTGQDAETLAARIAQGGFHPNPARGMIVGVIGPWRKGEPPSVPGDRVLARAPNSLVSTAFAKVGGHRLTIDLGNSIPETGFDLRKLDLGPLHVVAKAATGDVALGTLEYSCYDTAAYTATSGLAELTLDEAQARAALGADLEVRTEQGAALLTEQPLTVCPDPPNLYLEEGEAAIVELRAFERGCRPSSPVSITIVELDGPLPPMQVVTDDEGKATLPVSGGRAGGWTWILLAWRGQAPQPPARLVPELDEYLALRTTPADADIAALEPTWQNVHQHVLRYWEALAPCMDNWLRLSDEEQCRAYARLVRRLTGRERFNDFRYMPVTRDLTKGQRTLLHNWCDAVLGRPSAALEAPETPEAALQPTPFGRGF
ncbi:MAG: hypothetical protein ACRD0K_23405 [Egibacteraceae bacterium]